MKSTRLLVAGQARSGTTLLARVLDSQQRCTVLNERVLAPLQAVAFRGLRFTAPLDRRRRTFELGCLQQELGVVSEAFPITEGDFATLEQLFTRCLALHASPGDAVIGTKLCGMERILPGLLRRAPGRCGSWATARAIDPRGRSNWAWPAGGWRSGSCARAPGSARPSRDGSCRPRSDRTARGMYCR